MSYQVSSVFLQKFSPKEIHELKRVFKEHDRDYAAAVPVSELHTVLQKLGENVTPNQTTVMLQQTSGEERAGEHLDCQHALVVPAFVLSIVDERALNVVKRAREQLNVKRWTVYRLDYQERVYSLRGWRGFWPMDDPSSESKERNATAIAYDTCCVAVRDNSEG
ncbi:hypothetical protein GN958_ATG10743 [Phytophthora infestans]|uniref:EF-hand domain-containing protein n=1 Tax=Phytophthora infestans TaxID=4787 RepID=A0A8S9UHH6_PHYIN|nr:hypothetical protein GN958_ATG10743 [Phytophthora infestans]